MEGYKLYNWSYVKVDLRLLCGLIILRIIGFKLDNNNARMFTIILKELLGIKIAECNEIYVAKHYFGDEYKCSNNIAIYSFSERIRKHFWYYQSSH